MISYGIDLNATPDIGLFFGLSKEATCLAQDLVNRLQCSKGQLFYDPNYGVNLRNWLGTRQRTTDASRASAEIETELEQDERVADCTAGVVFDSASQSLTATIEITTIDGEEFTLVVLASTSLVKLLRIDQ